ncbi:tetratricopeptide repeat protein [Phreatobacter sp.]|uniref:tetratricopeptide repeat protein n=1 Tax=Phreatobacter sp. TaxID=1966341 RepID=UPI003F72DBDA
MPEPIAFDECLQLVLRLDAMKPSPAQPRRLDALFRDLARFRPQTPAYELQDLIWAIWTNHEDEYADEAMEQAINALAAKDYDVAHLVLDALVDARPEWAEAWNKRATLHFIKGDDGYAVADVMETLQREPRHFGAISGFAQICLRHGREPEALIAFEAALAINPHLEGVAALVAEMHANDGRVLH